MLFVLVDAWMFFSSKKVNVIVYLRRKYICRSALAPKETRYFSIPFPCSGDIG